MINKDVLLKFGAKLRYLRMSKKLSQLQLAEKAGLNFNFIGQIERAETNPTLKTIISIAEALEMDVKDLFDFRL